MTPWLPILRSPRGTAFLLTFALALVTFSRMPFLHSSVLNEDETVYLYVAQSTLETGYPYVKAFDHKGPLLYYAFAPMAKLGGGRIAPVRSLTTFYLLLTCGLVFLCALKLYTPMLAALAALFYGIYFNGRTDGLASNAELFMMLPSVGCLYAYLVSREKRERTALFVSGLLAAAAFFTKATALFTVAVVPALLLIGEGTPRQKARRLVFWGLGGVALSGAVFGWFAAAGHLGELLFSYFKINSSYTAFFDWKSASYQYLAALSDTLGSTLTGALAGVSGLTLLFYRRKVERFRFLLLAVLLAASLVGVFAAKQISMHYFLQLGLPFALLIPAALSLLDDEAVARMTLALFCLAALTHLTLVNRGLKTSLMGPQSPPDNEAQASAYIKGRTSEGDSLFIAHGSAILYYLSGRRYPGRYFHFYQHGLPMRLYTDSPADFERTVGGTKPRLVLSDTSPPSDTPYIQAWMDANYERTGRVGTYDVYEPKSP
jgi:4-amino-4-deoxy-L-arabinose transferase-like glycosyltransferase